jgi:putative endonuclease
MFEHRTAAFGFTARYHVNRLVYFESTQDPVAAITREKELKRWIRSKKVALISGSNPKWTDLATGWFASKPRRASEG